MSTSVNIVFFPQIAAAPVLIAHSQGFFAHENLEVILSATPDSPHLVRGLIDGRYQFGVALADNFVAYQAGQHSVPRDSDQELAIAMGLARTQVALVARAGVESVSDLRDRRIGVDAPQTGFALLLYQLIEEGGLTAEYLALIKCGSTANRLRELIAGRIDATILTPEFSAVAEQSGCHILSESCKLVGPCLGLVIGVNRHWASSNPFVVDKCMNAVRAALDWLAEDANLATASEVVGKALDLPSEVALRELRRLHKSQEFIHDGSVDDEGLQIVLNLRRRFVSPPLEIERLNVLMERHPKE